MGKENPQKEEQQQQQYQLDPFLLSVLFVMVVLMTFYVITRKPKRNISPQQSMFFDPNVKELKVPF